MMHIIYYVYIQFYGGNTFDGFECFLEFLLLDIFQHVVVEIL